jgi:hypothetical protein
MDSDCWVMLGSCGLARLLATSCVVVVVFVVKQEGGGTNRRSRMLACGSRSASLTDVRSVSTMMEPLLWLSLLLLLLLVPLCVSRCITRGPARHSVGGLVTHVYQLISRPLVENYTG